MPSQIEILRKDHADRKKTPQQSNLQKLLAKYGGEKHLMVPSEVKETIES